MPAPWPPWPPVLDGVYVRQADGALRFCPLPSPTAEDVAAVARSTYARLVRVCERHGRDLSDLDDAPDELGQDQLALAVCYGASVGDRQLLGAEPGQRTRKLAHPVRELASPDEALADVAGSMCTQGLRLTVVIDEGSSDCADTLRGHRSRRNASSSRPVIAD